MHGTPRDDLAFDASAPLRLALRKPPLISTLTFGALGGIALSLVMTAVDGQLTALSCALATALALAIVVVRVVRVRRSVRYIEVRRDELVLPARWGSGRALSVPFEELLGVQVLGSGRPERLVVSTRRALIVLPLRAFEESAALALFFAHLREKLARSIDGPKLVAAMEQRAALGARLVQIKPRFTQALLALLVATFAYELAEGAIEDPVVLLALGANARALVLDGQWFRLASAGFLHGSLPHLALNGLALLSVGSLLERLIGSAALSIVYGVSLLAGSLASIAFNQAPMSVGASGAIFGLLGALAVLNWRFGPSLPPGYRLPARQWILLVLLNGALPLLVPRIDTGAHLGGLLAGAAVALALSRGRSEATQLASNTRATWGAAVALALVLVGSLATALARDDDTRREDLMRVLEQARDEL